MSRSAFAIAISSVIGILGSTTGCVRRGNQLALGQELPVPSGLDTAQTRVWIAQQEERCPGRLIRLSDRGIFAVVCDESTHARRPPNER